MAHESFLAFLEKASQDPSLLEQLNAALDVEAVASVARAAGCTDVSAEDVSKFLSEVPIQTAASGDQELEMVTGGRCRGERQGGSKLPVTEDVAGVEVSPGQHAYSVFQQRQPGEAFIPAEAPC